MCLRFNLELESNITTSLKNIIMKNLIQHPILYSKNNMIGTTGAITDATWMLQTTHIIKSSGILNKAVLKWQAQTTAYKTKAQFITDFNKYHKEYLSKFKQMTTLIAHNVQKTNDDIEECRSMMNETRTVVNQVVEAQNSARDDAIILSTRSNIPTTVTTQPITALKQENLAM